MFAHGDGIDDDVRSIKIIAKRYASKPDAFTDRIPRTPVGLWVKQITRARCFRLSLVAIARYRFLTWPIIFSFRADFPVTREIIVTVKNSRLSFGRVKPVFFLFEKKIQFYGFGLGLAATADPGTAGRSGSRDGAGGATADLTGRLVPTDLGSEFAELVRLSLSALFFDLINF